MQQEVRRHESRTLLLSVIASDLGKPLFLYLTPLSLLPLVLLLRKNKRGVRSLLLRAVSTALLLLCLAEPHESQSTNTRRIKALFDVSQSVPLQSYETSLGLLQDYLSADIPTIQVTTFASNRGSKKWELTRSSSLTTIAREMQEYAKSLNKNNSNLASAIDSISKENRQTSVLLVSDGLSTKGDAHTSARQAEKRGVALFPILPHEQDFRSQDLKITSLYAPLTAKAGERVEIMASIKNELKEDQAASVEFWLDDKKIEEKQLRVAAERERVSIVTSPALKGGLKRIRLVLRMVDGATKELHRWISIKEKSKILLVSGKKTTLECFEILFVSADTD